MCTVCSCVSGKGYGRAAGMGRGGEGRGGVRSNTLLSSHPFTPSTRTCAAVKDIMTQQFPVHLRLISVALLPTKRNT